MHSGWITVRRINGFLLFSLVLVFASFWVLRPYLINFHLSRINSAGTPTCVLRKFNFTLNTHFNQIYRGNTGSYIDRSVLCYGGYELPVLFFIQDLLNRPEHQDGVVLDVGAHTGTHTMIMGLFAKEVHAFEPALENFSRLQWHIKENKLNSVTAHLLGLGNRNTTSVIFRDLTGGVRSSFVKDSWEDLVEGEELPIVRGDSFIKGNGIGAVTLIKIDIEGYEKFAFEGLKKTLESSRPVVIMELNMSKGNGYSSFHELQSSFPKNYAFLKFKNHVGPAACYELLPFEFKYDPEVQEQLVVFPKERADDIPECTQ